MSNSVGPPFPRKVADSLTSRRVTCGSFLQSIEIASMKEVRKVKSVQMFKRPVQRASQGDRVGMCVTQFDAKLLERGIACAPGYVTTIHGGVIDMVGRWVYNSLQHRWRHM